MVTEICGKCSECARHAYETIHGLCLECLGETIASNSDMELVESYQRSLFGSEVEDLATDLTSISSDLEDFRDSVDLTLNKLIKDLESTLSWI